jgi:hypothetical protein
MFLPRGATGNQVGEEVPLLLPEAALVVPGLRRATHCLDLDIGAVVGAVVGDVVGTAVRAAHRRDLDIISAPSWALLSTMLSQAAKRTYRNILRFALNLAFIPGETTAVLNQPL